MKAICVHQYGGPEVLSYEDIPAPSPGPREALVRIEAAGVNFIDVYHRTGSYSGVLPLTLGQEAAGVVEAIGPDVTDVQVGDRVAYALNQGAYAQFAVVPAARLAPIPAGVPTDRAAAAMLQGLTAHYLSHSTYPIRLGDAVLIHAAAGGVGLLLVQMAKRRGAFVIGTVSTEQKAALAREAGADAVILYTQVDFEAEVRRLTDGAGVHVVYDSVGRSTFDKSLNCLRRRGYLALFGQSSGAVAPIDPQILNAKGSLYLTRPTLGHYIADRTELLDRAEELFSWIVSGELHVRIDRTFPLAEAAAAQQLLESRATSGKLLLTP